ncbi:MAG TPA: hypothetical protein VF067_01410 [Sphingomicrobium sp.]
MTALAHPLTWASPRPLWRGAATPGLAPSILRFANDDFMDELTGLLDSDPGRLSNYVARFESWRSGLADRPQGALIERVPLPSPVKQARLQTRLRKSAPAAVAPAPTEKRRLKLYQPAHQRYYVAAGTLACAIHGLPDRKLAGGHEQVGFVLRRLLTESVDSPADSSRSEYAFLKDQDGARWQRVSDDDPAVLAPGEELLPLFPLAHREGNGISRTMWGGLIPVGRREEYMSAAVKRTVQRLASGQRAAAAAAGAAPAAPRNSKLARTAEFKADFAEPWKGLIQAAMKAADNIDADRGDKSSAPLRQVRIRSCNLGFQLQSWLLLVDLMAFFDRHMTDVATAVRKSSSSGLKDAKLELVQWLEGKLATTDRQRLADGFAPPAFDNSRPQHLLSIADALRAIDKKELIDQLETTENVYEDKASDRAKWPSFHYLLAGIASDGNGESIDAGGGFRRVPALASGQPADPEIDVLNAKLTSPADPFTSAKAPPEPFDVNEVDKLTTLVARALDVNDEAKARELPFAQKLSQAMRDTRGDPGLFLIRFVHLNADCGPLHPPTLSRPSETFELASFFDPDAPARPVRITLPMDTSPAGLRKHARGTAFVLSNMLCGQVQRAKGLGLIDLIMQVLPWPLHKDLDMGDGGGCEDNGVDIGMICSLSIPIITLCALILLLIIVFLLDFVFRWVPWLIMCFPVPKLKGKPA